jgi:tetratricopeptide (TPR) repeat protein
MRRALGPALWVAWLALAAPAPGQEAQEEGGEGQQPVPSCAADCQELERKGQLREGVTVQLCATSVCQQEGRNLYQQNRHREALASLDYVDAVLGGSPAFQMDRGLVLYALERFEEALAAFEQVLEAHPTSIRAGAQRAHTLSRLGRLDDAQEQFEMMFGWPGSEREFRAIKTQSYLRGNVGLLKLRRGEIPEGKRDLERALAIDGSNDMVNTLLHTVVPELEAGNLSPVGLGHMNAAFEALELKQAERAQASFEALLADSPRYAPAYLVLAQGFRARAEYAECENLLRLAEQRIPGNLDLRFQRLRCTILRHGVHSSASRPAIDELKALAEANPDNELGQQLLTALDER